MKNLRIIRPIWFSWQETKRLYALCQTLDNQSNFASNSDWKDLRDILITRLESIPKTHDISGVIVDKKQACSRGGDNFESQDYFTLKTDNGNDIYVFQSSLFDYDENTKSSENWELVKSMRINESWEMEGEKWKSNKYHLRSCRKIE